ncbi:uncharacterized protein VNE69_07071 [Vairimorpha necatrix]|uniref:Uncharacterized protein n=1 Tax=Vairimorpha necatrix TaxID=6039 RepID=A0AAX4JDD1_9MICR
MKDLHRILDYKSEKPLVWNSNIKILDITSHNIKTLEPFTAEEKYLIFKRKIIAPLIRPQKYYQKKNIKQFEDDRWLIKSKDDVILGPYTKSEMQEKINNNELVGTKIKRDYDRDFINYEIINEIPDFLNSQKLNDIFDTKDLESSKIEDAQPFNDNKHVENNKFVVGDRNGFFKCTEYLKYKKIPCKIEVLIKKLYGKDREASVNLIGILTNLKMEDCERLVELIILESGNSVIVDSNGFIKAHNKYTKKKSYE